MSALLFRSLGRSRSLYCRSSRRFSSQDILQVENAARLDLNRTLRTGFPEVIYASGKTPQHLSKIFVAMAEDREMQEDSATKQTYTAPVIASRVSQEQFNYLRDQFASSSVLSSANKELYYNESARLAYYHSSNDVCQVIDGKVCVVCAGTSDFNVSEEAAVILELMGMGKVTRVYDVGVAGLHRLLGQVDNINDHDVIIAVAGMDGAMPSVISGLVTAPVVAVPTSIGYGAAFQGLAPLLSMLLSCSPGISVVNIDNGLGVAAFAVKLINRLVEAKKRQQ